MIAELSAALLNKLGYLILFGFSITKTKFFKNYLMGTPTSKSIKMIIATLWGLFGVVMTLWGTPVFGGIANSRTIPIVLAGLLGGPFMGFVAGFIAGFHRMFLTVGGELTAISCGISTLVAGVAGGLLKDWIRTKENKAYYGFLIGVGVEVIQMLIILMVARPFNEALLIVKTIFLPMTFLNAAGVAIFLLFIDQVIKESDNAGAVKAQMALKIANKTVPIFRLGLNNETAEKAAKTIYKYAQVDAVSFTSTNECLAFIGSGSDHHLSGSTIHTSYTKNSIQKGVLLVAKKKEEIGCSTADCPLGSVVVVPLFLEGVVIGTLKLYKARENAMTSSDIELAKGLGELFSTQLALSKIDEQAVLLKSAEIKTLRAQIQPHFLFNALNTVMALIRIDPQKAREVLTDLSYFLRSSFKLSAEKVTLEDELETVKAYVNVEKARFEERISIEYDINAPLSLMIPPLMIQPLVENAIKHGIINRQSGGLLKLSIYLNKDELTISVEDNGKGIPKDIVESLKRNQELSGIGLSNINRRLMNHFDRKLQIRSMLNSGTKVSFSIPMEKELSNV
ncbi:MULTISPECIES: LytS/YhcK type 5TM receptor domain-containing protein [unclassified Fusibacter]|uniref:LytS/YhcK type 5TM receptor domain-containing protein n=1 Tax=unclassified Fusibacter TaxID=2624464 RepID=UPI0010121120|nr:MULTISPECIES: LytS/YhcK type 5TM receptor domain-containing protein [unclassified Fusibacter]MCK8058195.1 histidine kinase [Fusibacter sp. A2]NPE20778.1 histidine kinase [Fusibacter sp. A1]RXV62984.1 sensor histidine kinase [Fusibacter sp. A1]